MGSFLKKASFGLALPFVLLSLMAAQAPTTTTLAIGPANYVAAGTIVTLTATVTNPGTVTSGTVKFCNALSTDCSLGSGLYGTAQITSAGTATIRKSFGYGVNNISAVFLPTNANAGSRSLANFVTVGSNSIYTSTTTLAASGTPGNYTLSGTVTAFGNEPLTGETIGFLDTSSGNSQISSASLSPAPSTFVPWTPATSGGTSVATGDFNGDGYLDFAITTGGRWLTVALGHGDGTFGAPVIYATGNGSESVTVADVNDDGKPDLIVTNAHGGTTVSVLLGNGDGTFQNQMTYNAGGGVSAYPNGIVVGDFNGDGIPDIAATLVNTQIAILIGNGSGGFQAPVLYPAGNMPFGIAAADVNGDGKLDIIAADEGGGAVAVLLGNGDGSFRAPVTYPVGFDPQNVALADFNGDGKIDIAVENQNSGTVSILLGNGDGTFQPQAK
jgi:hypothetical protein